MQQTAPHTFVTQTHDHQVSKLFLSLFSLCRLGRSSNTLFLAAKDAAFQRDEEKAYVFFMRFLELGKKIRASKEYKSKKVS